MKSIEKSFWVSKEVLNTFDKLVKQIGLPKQWLVRVLLLNEAFFLLWPFHGSSTMKQPLKNSDLGLKFLEQRQRGKIQTEFGVNAQLKDVKRTFVDINKDDIAIYEGICKSSNVSISALFEFMMTEAILRANGDILAHKHKGKLRPLFTNKVQGSGFEAKRQELSNCIVKLHQVTLDEIDKEAKRERMEQALFISDGLIPNSFKKKFREDPSKKAKK